MNLVQLSGGQEPLQFLFCLLDQSDTRQLHFFVDRFAHVVDRKKCRGDAGKRFHFDASLRSCARSAFYLRMIV